MKKIIAICLAALMAAACKRSYPGLYAPIVDPDNPNPEVTVDRIPITVSLTDPAYALVTGAATRGNGPFGFWDNEEDRRELRRLIEAHVRHTNSALGRRMLDAWEQYAPQFIKITPVEYKRYLEQQPR